jgi:hypothetical protein
VLKPSIRDRSPIWTGLWRENATFAERKLNQTAELWSLSGTESAVNEGGSGSIQVDSAFSTLWMWRNTSVARLPEKAEETFPNGTLGYEWDVVTVAGRPDPSLMALSETYLTNVVTLNSSRKHVANPLTSTPCHNSHC